jgi:hypothetical protein
MTEGEEKGLVLSVASWLWGTVKGGFNEQQSIAQIIVDAAVGMIPLVGDVTAVRDLIAVILRLAQHPEKRKEKGEWILLVVLLFALIPVAGGVIKGVGRLLIKVGEDVAQISTHAEAVIKFLNRVGRGDQVQWFRKLDLDAYLPVVRAKWGELMSRLDGVMGSVLTKMRHLLPDSMLQHLAEMRTKFREIVQIAESMIPEGLKELNRRLKLLQRHVYAGEWHEISASLKSATREVEARIVRTAKGEREWAVANAHFPQNKLTDYHHVAGWPDLRELRDRQGRLFAIEGFSGQMRAIHIPPGTKVRRVVDYRGPTPAGCWWTYELPATGRQWREDLAVLNDFSHNRVYVEITVGPEGLIAWEGKAASQIDRSVASEAGGQYLQGGGVQLFIDFRVTNAQSAHLALEAPLRPTGWTDHMDVNIPKRADEVQELGEHELATKVTPAPAAARLAAKAVSGASASPEGATP